MSKLGLLSCLLIITQAGCSVVGVRTAEELEYDVLEEQDDFEIREYAPYISAEASKGGENGQVQGSLFRVLAGYIFGKNTTEESIAMTAPVLMKEDNNSEEEGAIAASENEEDSSEKIAMTAPVIMEKSDEGAWKMAFSMPAEYTMETLPKPLDDRITLVEVPARTLAVIRFSGSFNDWETRAEKEAALLAWLKDHPEFSASGKPFYAGYDPPFTVPFLRRNEVLIEVDRVGETQ